MQEESELRLKIEDLHVEVNGREVVSGVNLQLEKGKLSLLTGPNGSGKSSLLNAIIGNPKYHIRSGRIFFEGKDILNLSLTERTMLGIGIAFQFPPKIRGIKLKEFVELLSKRYNVSKEEVEYYVDFLRLSELLERDVNVNFSGGEIKRAELLTILLQKPKLALIDEPDSGVDVENTKIISYAIKELVSQGSSALIITHTGNITKYISDVLAYVMLNGKIVCSGNAIDVFKDIFSYGFEGCLNCKKIRS